MAPLAIVATVKADLDAIREIGATKIELAFLELISAILQKATRTGYNRTISAGDVVLQVSAAITIKSDGLRVIVRGDL